MLSGKGEGGGRQGGSRQESQESGYEEPAFNPDDDIPF